MTRETESSSSGAQGRGGPAYPSGTPPYGSRAFPSLHPQERPRPADAVEQPPADEPPAPGEPKTETTLTTRIRINIPGSRPIPPVVVRTPVDDATAAAAVAAAAGTGPGIGTGTGSGAGPGRGSGAASGSTATASGGTAAAASAARAEQDAPAEPEKKEKATSDWFAPRKPVAPQPADGERDTAIPPAAGGDPFGDPDTGSRPYPPRHDTPASGMPAFGTEDFPPGVPRPVDPFAAEERTPEFPPPAGPTAGPVRGVMSVPPYGPGGRPAADDGGHSAPGADFPGPYGDGGGPHPPEASAPTDFATGDFTGRDFTRPEFADTDFSRPDGSRPDLSGAGLAGADRPGPYGQGRPGGTRSEGFPGDGFPGAGSGFDGPRPGGASPFGGPSSGGPGGREDTLVGGIPPVPPEDDRPREAASRTPAPAPAGAEPAGKQAAPARKGRSKLVLLGVAVGAVAVVAYGAGLLMNHSEVPKDTTVLGVQIGDMTKDQAVQTLDKALGGRTTAPLTLTVNGRQEKLKPSVAGLSFDADATVRAVAHTDYNPVSVIGSLFGGARTADPVIGVDNDKLKAALTSLAGRSSTGAEPMVKFADHKAIAVPGRSGTSFDVDAAAAQVAAAYRTRAQTGADRPIALAVTTVQPKVTQAELDRAVNGFGRTAMSGQVIVRADAAHMIRFNKSLPTFLTMVADGQGKLVPHVDLTVLKGLYGQTFHGVMLQRPDGSKTAVTPQDVANALIKALGAADPAGRTVTLPHMVP